MHGRTEEKADLQENKEMGRMAAVVTVTENQRWHTFLSSPALAEMFDCLKPLQIFKVQERCHCLSSVPTSNRHTLTHKHTSKRTSCQSLTTVMGREKPRSFSVFSAVWLRGSWRGLSETLMLLLVTSYTLRNTHTTGVHSTTRSAVFAKPRWWETFIAHHRGSYGWYLPSVVFFFFFFFKLKREQAKTKRLIKIHKNPQCTLIDMMIADMIDIW